MRSMHSSRRAPPLADSDIDHEIRLVDHDVQPTNDSSPPRARSPSIVSVDGSESLSDEPLAQSDSHVPLTQNAGEGEQTQNDRDLEANRPVIPRIEEPTGEEAGSSKRGSGSSAQAGKPLSRPSLNGRRSHNGQTTTPKEPETAIDILYENQRGGFLCGIPLFSSAALGNLDPPAWTNFAHKPSPTDIHTAQVPDPSWQWAWPEWRINHDESIQTDGDGWEYSFMFSKRFSWHAPKWYNSFVRRRAWIRRRVKTATLDEYGLNRPYFTVMPKKHELNPFATASDIERVSMDRQSQGDSRLSRDRSGAALSSMAPAPEVKTAEDLMFILGQLRIDREKLEAIENYIKNGTDDLQHLQDHMHQIMSTFVFQASRKTLLARLTQLQDEVTPPVSTTTTGEGDDKGKDDKGKAPELTPRAENLAAAIRHADEEVRKLEYWSDIKGMTEEGEAARAVDDDEGWDKGWQGLDRSGPKGVDGEGDLP